MKNRKNTFRITALLLTAAMTVAMLCGCDSNTASTEPEDSEQHYSGPEITQPAPSTGSDISYDDSTSDDNTSDDSYIVYPAMEPYLGTWVLAQETANYTEKTITFKIKERNVEDSNNWWEDLMNKLFG